MHYPEIAASPENDSIHLYEKLVKRGTVPGEFNPVLFETGELQVWQILPYRLSGKDERQEQENQ